MEKNSNYHRRSWVETSCLRYQQLVGSPLSRRDDKAQVGEMLADVKRLNPLSFLDTPIRQAIA